MIQSYCRIAKPEPKETNSQPVFIWYSSFRSLILISGIFLAALHEAYAQSSILDERITIQRTHTTLYNALNLISEKADCLFIYDSQIVESDKKVKLEAENKPLKQVLDNILSNPDLTYKVIGRHILIYKAKKEESAVATVPKAAPEPDSLKQIIVKGHVFDNQTKKPIPYATIGIMEQNLGTVANTDGYFLLKVPSQFRHSSLTVSCLGYLSSQISLQLLDEQKVDIFLDRRIISIQEVIIRYVDPEIILTKAINQRKLNNALDPVYMTTFYREGIQKNDRFVSYSEAVFKVYKSAYTLNETFDQVKLLKSRKIQNVSKKDTVLVKLKAGIQSGLQLDIVKSIPDFLDLDEMQKYSYSYSDLISYNDKDVYAIAFIQKKEVNEPLYKGTIYIEKESFAILGADFEINPDYLDDAAKNLVLKKSRKLIVKLERINYSVNYKLYNGRYYLNHARCDMKIKTRLRNHLWSDNFSTFLEIAVCNIDSLNVTHFSRQELIKPDVVFSEVPYTYDDAFWGMFNTITPEEKLNEALSRVISKIEKIE